MAVALASLASATHAAPTGVTVTAGASELTVDWTASTGADGYRVQWKSGTEDWDPNTRQTTISDGTTETATISSLTPATVYTVRVGATKGTEDPAWSDTATGAPLFGCDGSTAVGSVQPVTGPNNDLIDDCENLLAAKDPLRGTASLNWATTTAIGSWNGITVTNNRVTLVQFNQSGLTGTIPAVLGNLASLTHLTLHRNQLSGTIPAGVDGNDNPTGLAKLTNLTNLDLSRNQLTGGIPVALSRLSNLVNLRLWDNQLTGGIPAGEDAQSNPTGLARLSKLKWLHLQKNQLTGEIPAALGRLDKVLSLLLFENQLSGGIPAALGGMDSLERLYLNNNQLTGGIPAGEDAQSNPTGLAQLSNLVQLRLYRNQLTGGIPSVLGDLDKLTQLLLSDNQLSGAIPTALGDLTKLQYLYLHRNQLTGSIPLEFGNLVDMRYMYLHQNQLTGTIPAGTDSNNNATGLAKMTALRRIYLNCNDLTGTVPAALGSITTLTHLGINGNAGLSQDLPPSLSSVQTPTVVCTVVVRDPTPAPTPTPAPVRVPAPRPKLAAALSAAPDPVTVGETVTYTLTVTNTGEVPLTGVFWRSPGLGVGRSDIGDGTLAVDAAAEATFSFGPVTAEHLPGPIVVTVFADSDQTDGVRAALGVAVQAAPATPPASPAPDGSGAGDGPAPAGASAGDDPAPTQPRPAESMLDVSVTNAGFSSPDQELGHNILDLWLTPDDGGTATDDGAAADVAAVDCHFLAHYEATGGLARWGYAISEIIEERLGALTQYYQRGAVDCHFREGRWRMERRLTWDYLGGGLGGAPDLGFEPGLFSDQPGELVGPWGHRVSNYAVDGTFTGFLDFFEALGGVRAFGYPKTEARRDDHPDAVLRLPRGAPEVIRQYFQAAVFEYHPDDADAPVKLGLAGDLLRDLIYPDEAYAPFRSFHPVPRVTPGQPYTAERVIWSDGG